MSDILATLGIDLRFLLVATVGFVLLFLLLKKFTFGPIFNMLQARQDNIKNNLDEAEARRTEMVRLQNEYEARLAQIEDEARDKIQAAVKEAQAARDDIITRAQADRDALLKRTEEDIVREREKTLSQLRDQIANMAVTGASRILQKNLDANSHSGLIDDVIADIGYNNGAPKNGSVL